MASEGEETSDFIKQWECEIKEKEQLELQKFDIELENIKAKAEKELLKMNADLRSNSMEEMANTSPTIETEKTKDGAALDWSEVVRWIEKDISENNTALSEGQKIMLDLMKQKSKQ